MIDTAHIKTKGMRYDTTWKHPILKPRVDILVQNTPIKKSEAKMEQDILTVVKFWIYSIIFMVAVMATSAAVLIFFDQVING